MSLEQNLSGLLHKADIVKIISVYLPLQAGKKAFKGQCPFHEDTSSSLMVSAEKNVFKCFGCGKEGGPADFVMAIEGKPYEEAVRQLGTRLG